jgi:hypothetical protein
VLAVESCRKEIDQPKQRLCEKDHLKGFEWRKQLRRDTSRTVSDAKRLVPQTAKAETIQG